MYYIEEIKNGGVLNSVLLLISLLPHSALNSSCLGRGVFFFISFLLLLITAQGKPPIPMWCAIICLCVCNLQAMPTGNMPTLLGHLLLSPCLDLVLGVMTALFFFNQLSCLSETGLILGGFLLVCFFFKIFLKN